MKNKLANIGIGLVFLIVFNVIFFVIGGFDHGTAEWISYLFITLAYLCMVLVPLISENSKNNVITRGSVTVVSSTYFIVEFVVGLIFILALQSAWQAALVIQIIMFAAYVIGAFFMTRANDRTAAAEQVQAAERAQFNTLVMNAQMLVSAAKSDEMLKEIEQVVDDLRCSPVKSIPEVAGIEGAIFQQLNDLQVAVYAGNAEQVSTLSASIRQLVTQRNQMLLHMK